MNIRYFLILILPVVFTQTACKKWLDVKPKTQIDAEVLYQRESGFKDVLYGAYVNLASPAMYGREMTFGLVDVIGHAYPSVGSATSAYGYAKSHDYANSTLEPLIATIWQNSYNTIANLNSLIGHLRTADKTLFAADNYNVILGEALGLRAYLHFDLLKLFAPSYKANAAAKAIPYTVSYGSAITAEGTVTTVLDSISKDLEEAAALLKTSDPIFTNRLITATTDDGYLLQRNYHFNYYAARGIMARVAIYKGDNVNAAKYADEIIDSGKFPWIKVDAVAVADDAQRDRTFSTEQVFVLNTPKMVDYIVDRFQYNVYGSISGLALYSLTADINKLYPEANDWRKLYFWSLERSGVNNQRFNTKLWQPVGMPAALSDRMPLIRLPELYLISAEAVLTNNPAKTISRLRDLRTHRGLDAGIPDGTLEAALSAEIIRQYRQEFVAEGVLFYMYKRLDVSTIEGVTGTFDKTKYVLPKPVSETQFR